MDDASAARRRSLSAPAGLFPDPPWHAPDAPSSRARVPHRILTTRPRRDRVAA
jgi:hypothetical protein